MITGNKGEWSEIYVLFKLLAEGNLHAADEKLEKNPNLFYPIIKILREEVEDKKREYVIGNTIKIIDGNTKKLIVSIPVKEFVKASVFLFDVIKKSKNAFPVPEIEKFMQSIDCKALSDSRGKKEDINIVVHDLRTGLQPLLGFSIKSMLGGSSTLFNPGRTTNFIYNIKHKDNKKLNINTINEIQTKPVISSRLKFLLKEGFDIKFHKIESANFQVNLELIDSKLPAIMSYLLLYKYTESVGSNINELTKILTKNNPLSFNLYYGHPFYEFKIKNFLTDSALGMTPSKLWVGKYDATGGFIIVRNDGELVCYHIYNRYEFQEYLFNNTWLDQASTSRYGFGDLYDLHGETFIKLNLQVRFI